MASQRPVYKAYLLRLWPVRSAGDTGEWTSWRAVLENVHTRERQGFASLEELFEFLRTRMEVMIEDGETDSEHELR